MPAKAAEAEITHVVRSAHAHIARHTAAGISAAELHVPGQRARQVLAGQAHQEHGRRRAGTAAPRQPAHHLGAGGSCPSTTTTRQANIFHHDKYVTVVVPWKGDLSQLSGLYQFVLCLRAPHLVFPAARGPCSLSVSTQDPHNLKPVVFICVEKPPAAFLSFLVRCDLQCSGLRHHRPCCRQHTSRRATCSTPATCCAPSSAAARPCCSSATWAVTHKIPTIDRPFILWAEFSDEDEQRFVDSGVIVAVQNMYNIHMTEFMEVIG